MGKKLDEVPATEILDTPGIEQAAFDNVMDTNQFADISDNSSRPKAAPVVKKNWLDTLLEKIDNKYIIVGMVAIIILALVVIISLAISEHHSKKETDSLQAETEVQIEEQTESAVVESESHESAKGAEAVIEKYWNAYVDYNKTEMEKCFILDTELTKHTEKKESEAEYTYGDIDIICLSEDKSYRQSHYMDSTMDTLKKDTGLDIEEYNDYSLSADATLTLKDADESSKGTVDAFFTVIKVDGEYYLLGEPSVIVR